MSRSVMHQTPDGRVVGGPVQRAAAGEAGLVYLLAGLGLSLTSIAVLGTVGAPEAISGLFASILAPLPAAAHEARRGAGHGSSAWDGSGYTRSTAVLVGLAVGALSLTHVALAYCTAAVAAGSYLEAGRWEFDWYAWFLGHAILAIVPLCLITYYLMRAIAARLRTRPHWWCIVAVLCGATLQTAWLAASPHPLQRPLLINLAIAVIAQVGVALAAAERAARTRVGYRVAWQVRRLPMNTQRELVALLSQNPATPASQAFGASMGGIGVGIVATLIAYTLLITVDVPELVASTVAGAVGLVPAGLANHHMGRRDPRGEFQALGSGQPINPPLLLSFMVTLGLVMARNVFVQTAQWAAGGWMAPAVAAGQLDPTTGRQLMILVSYGLATALSLIGGYVILRAAADRLGQHALRYLVWSVASAGLLQLLLNLALGSWAGWLIMECLVFVGLALVARLAVGRAKSNVASFATRRLMQHLSTQDATAIAELVAEVESRSGRWA